MGVFGADSWLLHGEPLQGAGTESLSHGGRMLLSSRVAGVGVGVFLILFFMWVLPLSARFQCFKTVRMPLCRGLCLIVCLLGSRSKTPW